MSYFLPCSLHFQTGAAYYCALVSIYEGRCLFRLQLWPPLRFWSRTMSNYSCFSIQALWNLRSPSTIKCWIFPLVSNEEKKEHPVGWLNTHRHARPDPPLCLSLLLDSLRWRNPIYWAGRDSRTIRHKQRKRAYMCNIVFEIEVQAELKSFFGNRLEKQGHNVKVTVL